MIQKAQPLIPGKPAPVHVGQRWCRFKGLPPEGTVYALVETASELFVVLCDCFEDRRSGELTFKPVKWDDLPQITS